MPALRHLELYDDILLPEPSTLFEEHRGRAPPSRYQEMNIHRNLGLEVDLFLPKLEDAKKKESPNTHSVKNLNRMNEEQLSTWQLSWRPKNEAFWREAYEGEALIRWKYQRFVKNYLRCLKGIDENIGRVVAGINESTGNNCILFYTASKGRFLGENGWYGDSWAYDPTAEGDRFDKAKLAFDEILRKLDTALNNGTTNKFRSAINHSQGDEPV